jgi:NADPH-dependent ferric siderophore reductase
MLTAPDQSSIDLAQRLGVLASVCQVVSSHRISPSLQEVILKGDVALAGVPGNDVMIRVTDATGRPTRRRYSVRSVDAEAGTFTLWIAQDHNGPGAQWAGEASVGDSVDVVGPRGKIPLDPMADWHLFIGDVSALGSFYRMAQSIEVPGRAIFIVETDHAEDAVTATFDEGLGVTGIFVDRAGRSANDPAGLLSGLSAFAFPPDDGHAYLFGEFHVTKVLQSALTDRGLDAESISRKAFWRFGQANEDRGEPAKD